MKKILLIAGLLAGLGMLVFCLHPDWDLSEAGPPLPVSLQEQDHRDHDKQQEAPPGSFPPNPESLQIRRSFGQDSRDPLPPGDWDWEVIRHHCPGSGRPDSPFMRDLGLDGYPAILGGGVPDR